jgi:hypothetical protein
MAYNVSSLGDYSQGSQKIPENLTDYLSFNLTTIQSAIKKKNASKDQTLKNYDLIMNALKSMKSMYNEVPNEIKGKIDQAFNLLDKAGISLDDPLTNSEDVIAAMNRLADMTNNAESEAIFDMMDIEEAAPMFKTASAEETMEVTAAGSEINTDLPLQAIIRSDFVDVFLKYYEITLEDLGEALKLTTNVLKDLTRLSEILNQFEYKDTPKTNFPPQSNDDILNLIGDSAKDPFLEGLVDILNGSGSGAKKIDKDPYTGKKIDPPMKYGDYFKQQLQAGDPNAYKLVLDVGKQYPEKNLDMEIAKLWTKTIETQSPVYPSDQELMKLGAEVLKINQELKDYIELNDPQKYDESGKPIPRFRDDPKDPIYELNNIVKQIDATFKPYNDLLKQGVTDPTSLNDALIECTQNFLKDGQDDPLSSNQKKMAKMLKTAETSFAALSEKNTRELQAKTAEQTNFLQQGAAFLKMLSDMIVRTAQNIGRG